MKLKMNELFEKTDCIEGRDIVIKRITADDEEALQDLISSDEVYLYEPTFLFERNIGNAKDVIERLYSECIGVSLILGIYRDGLCGLIELYGLNERMHKISIGYRLRKCCWGRGIASAALGMMVGHLYDETETEIITASTLPANIASERVLEKNGFEMVVSGADEDWGYDKALATNKWIR